MSSNSLTSKYLSTMDFGFRDQENSGMIQNLRVLDAIHFPVLIVDSDLRIRYMNQTATRELGLSQTSLIKKGGDALHCVNSMLNKYGCGSTAACKECVIRNSVKECLETGTRVQHRTKARFTTDDGVAELDLLIFTDRLPFRGEPLVVLTIMDLSKLPEGIIQNPDVYSA